MKKITLLIIINFCLLFANAQTHHETLTACGVKFDMVSEIQQDNSTKVTIIRDNDNKVEYSIKTSSLDVFASTFADQLSSLIPSGTNCTQAQKDALLAYGKTLYFTVYVSNTNNSSVPLSGTLSIRDSISVYVKHKDSVNFNRLVTRVKIKKVSLEINDGYIETINAYIEIGGKGFNFVNQYGIGFSSFKNFRNFQNTRLFELNSAPFGKNGGGDQFFINLNELLKYDFEIGLNRRDFSPKNIALTINGGESIKLYKDETNKLLEAAIFTDFLGLSDDKPNGIIQTEISKKIAINTSQFQSSSFFYGLFKSYGIFQSITPVVTFSKIESRNKNLILRDLDSLRYNAGQNDTTQLNKYKHRFTTPLSLYQYQSFSAGAELNVLNLSNHDLKYTFSLNLGFRLGITPVTDSLTTVKDKIVKKTGFVKNYSVNTLQYYPQATITFLPEERFNFSMSEKLTRLSSLNSDFVMLSFDKATNQKIVRNNAWINTFEFFCTFQINDNSKVFGRARLNSELKNSNSNFAQIQLGYSVYILGGK